MRPTLPFALSAVLVVSACATISQSRFNPLNWFGRSEEVLVSTPRSDLRPLVGAGELTQTVDTRALIQDVTGLQVDRTPAGAIVSAQGVAESQGYFNAQLVRQSLENGVLTFAFRVEEPPQFEVAGTVASRTVTVATELDNSDLFGVRTIVVLGENSSRRVSR